MVFNGNKFTLLLVSSSVRLSEKISGILREENFAVVHPSAETEVLQKTKEFKPDVILFCPDKSSPRECGMIRQIRSTPATRDIPVIFISSIDDETIVSECLHSGYTDFIATPLRPKELLLRIKHQLSLLEAKRTIKRQNERLKQTIASRDQLYAVIAHDLRSPIGTIKMINSAIENEKEKIQDPGILRKFEMINETTEEAFNLLENLLRWSRNQNGKTKVLAENFNLSAAVRQVLSLFTTIAKAKNISLNNEVRLPFTIYADEDMIKTVIRNLISNAIKFTYPGGKVDISAIAEKTKIKVEVRDNGKGISTENQCHLFKKGKNLSTAGTKNEKGCGLGLLLCYDFIKRNKGELGFTSREGQGSTFYFTVPRACSWVW